MSLLLLAFSIPALAGVDLRTTLTPPTGVQVYEPGSWTATVANLGNKDAAGVVLRVTLPATNTSPQVYLMGTLGALPSGCSLSVNVLTCNLGTIKKFRSTTLSFDVSFPQAAEVLEVAAAATTTTSGDPTGNNSDAEVADLLHPEVAYSPDVAVTNRHCTGTGLSSFFECELFPSSISEHAAVLHEDGSISFPTESDPLYGGTWWSDSPDHLVFEYTYDGAVVADFEGWGVPGDCWEGLTSFDDPWVAPYEVCVD